MKNVDVVFQDLGTKGYKETWLIQEELFRSIVQLKIKSGKSELTDVDTIPNNLLFVEHPHVFTLGKSGDAKNLLLSEDQLKQANAEFYKIDRGGDITYHGPGQIVGYPIIDLENFGIGVHQYVWQLEEVLISCLKHYAISASRIEGATGVWVDADKPDETRKIAAIGVRASRHVTMHGWALNVNSDLDYFQKIIPCGIPDKKVTSIANELGSEIDLDEVKLHLANAFAEVFNCKIVAPAPSLILD